MRVSRSYIVAAVAGGLISLSPAPVLAGPEMTLDTFLDRLMIAESGGRANAKNSRSTALGAYQFIASTWLQVMHASFTDDIKDLPAHEVLDLRLDPKISRRAAKIYTEQNAAYLANRKLPATFANLRLAFLVGPGGAASILEAKADTPVATLLGATAVGANPFLKSMTVADLLQRVSRDISDDPRQSSGVAVQLAAASSEKHHGTAARAAKPRPQINVACSLSLPSCRRWLALAKQRASKQRFVSKN